MGKLPILVSVPHGGDAVPVECKRITSLTSLQIFEDGDGFTRQIYDFQDRVVSYVSTSIARAFVDMNRKRDDLAPANPDGVIKSETIQGVKVYRNDRFPDQFLIEELLLKYYDPYHRKIEEAMSNQNIVLAFDCHSMLPLAPDSSTFPGKTRPMICISNGGDHKGKQINADRPITCPSEMLDLFADYLADSFEVQKKKILLNEPFNGGTIMRSHFKKEIPWIQLELNRSLYLTPEYFSPEKIICDSKILLKMKEKIWKAMENLASNL